MAVGNFKKTPVQLVKLVVVGDLGYFEIWGFGWVKTRDIIFKGLDIHLPPVCSSETMQMFNMSLSENRVYP
jgi:hypothetical protein